MPLEARPHTAMTFHQNVKIPPQCVCCMGLPTTSISIGASSSHQQGDQEITWKGTWNFPCCKDCKTHLENSDTPHAIGCIGGLALGAAYVFLFTEKEAVDWGVGVGIVIAFFAVAKLGLAPLMPKGGPRCAGNGNVVVCEMRGPGQFNWAFKNREYGKLFEKLNS